MPAAAPLAAAAAPAGGARALRRGTGPVLAALLLAPALTACAARRGSPDPLTAEEHVDLGVAYYRRGAHRYAVREFARATAMRPDWARAWVNLGDARLAGGELAGAIEAYERARALAPDDPGTANNLAWALLQDERRWPEAEPIIRRALERNPEPRGYYLDTLGTALLRRGDVPGALAAFRAALADPGLQEPAVRAAVLERMAEAHVALGNIAAAERCRALARDERGRGEGRELGGSASVC